MNNDLGCHQRKKSKVSENRVLSRAAQLLHWVQFEEVRCSDIRARVGVSLGRSVLAASHLSGVETLCVLYYDPGVATPHSQGASHFRRTQTVTNYEDFVTKRHSGF